MKDLHVYVDPLSTDKQGAGATFYSRRADGPYYVWLYEEKIRRWSFSRVHLSKLTLRALSIANWNAVPIALQSRLGEHYLE